MSNHYPHHREKYRNNFLTVSFSLFYLSVTFLILCDTFFCFVHSIEPEPLWVAINTTLSTDNLICGDRNCVKIILYNDDAKEYVKANYTGNDFIIISLDGNQPDGFMTDELTEKVRNQIVNLTKTSPFLPCILVLSLVNTSRDLEEMKNLNEDEIQDKKYGLMKQFTKMLQYRTPINQRKLMLVRFGHDENEFGPCRNKKLPYLKYPRRLVPTWEQVLFDFFPSGRIVHAITGEKSVMTRKEEGDWLWMCEELIQKLDKEDECRKDMTKECQAQIDRGEFSSLGLDLSNCSKYQPRM